MEKNEHISGYLQLFFGLEPDFSGDVSFKEKHFPAMKGAVPPHSKELSRARSKAGLGNSGSAVCWTFEAMVTRPQGMRWVLGNQGGQGKNQSQKHSGHSNLWQRSLG